MPTSLHGAVKISKPVNWLSPLVWSSKARLQVVQSKAWAKHKLVSPVYRYPPSLFLSGGGRLHTHQSWVSFDVYFYFFNGHLSVPFISRFCPKPMKSRMSSIVFLWKKVRLPSCPRAEVIGGYWVLLGLSPRPAYKWKSPQGTNP